MRDGVTGTLADLDTGKRTPTRELLRVHATDPRSHALIEANGALRLREVGIEHATAYLAECFS